MKRDNLNKAMINTVFFDVGGTLLHVEWDRVLTILQSLKTPAEINQVAKQALLEYAKRTTAGTARVYEYLACCLEAARVSVSEEQLSLIWRQHLEKNLWRAPAPQVEETLQELLRQGFRIAVISNSEGKVKELLQETHLARYFEIIVDSGVEGVAKPDKEIFLRACGRMKVKPEESLYIGDVFEIDVVGAQSVGMHAALLDPHGLYEDSASNGFQVLRAISEITERI
jgi:HAD superfamily hydrolase (TIGR01662 family)